MIRFLSRLQRINRTLTTVMAREANAKLFGYIDNFKSSLASLRGIFYSDVNRLDQLRFEQSQLLEQHLEALGGPDVCAVNPALQKELEAFLMGDGTGAPDDLTRESSQHAAAGPGIYLSGLQSAQSRSRLPAPWWTLEKLPSDTVPELKRNLRALNSIFCGLVADIVLSVETHLVSVVQYLERFPIPGSEVSSEGWRISIIRIS